MNIAERTEHKRATKNEQDLDEQDFLQDLPIKNLLLGGVQLEEKKFLGEGAFGGVYRAVYNGVACAIKQQSFQQDQDYYLSQYTVQDFHRECLLHSKLRHPNIVKMYGVCYHSERPDQPMKVMELVEGGTLALLLNHHHVIPMYVKLSLLQDVSRGLSYLHFCRPPIMHHHINTDIILLTSTLTAKIGSFTFAQEEKGHTHGLSFDVFLFGYIVCRMVTQLSLDHLYQYMVDPYTNKLFVAYNTEPRELYLDCMGKGPLKQLAVRCLDDDYVKRPTVLHVCERIDQMLQGEF